MPGKKFRFPFENVLKLRHHEAEKARQDLADAMQHCERQENVLAEAHRRLTEIVTTLPSGSGTDPRALKQHDSFRRDAQRACAEAQRVLNLKRIAEQEARAKLIERQRAEEALSNLRDQQRVQHEREAEAQDLAFIDEQAISRYARKP